MTSGAFSATWARSGWLSVATMPATGDFSVERVDAFAQAGDLQRLGIPLRALAAQFELQAVLLEAAGLHGMRVVELGGFQVVARALEVALRDHMDVPGILGALELALRGGDLHLGEVGVLAALENRAPDFDGLAIERRPRCSRAWRARVHIHW